MPKPEKKVPGDMTTGRGWGPVPLPEPEEPFNDAFENYTTCYAELEEERKELRRRNVRFNFKAEVPE